MDLLILILALLGLIPIINAFGNCRTHREIWSRFRGFDPIFQAGIVAIIVGCLVTARDALLAIWRSFGV